MNKPIIIGVSSLSGGGKNTFCKLLSEELSKLNKSSIELSFAAKLREKTRKFLWDEFGLNVWTQNRQEKAEMRDFLTVTADIWRRQTKGKFFVNGVINKINELKNYKYDFILISDLRFKEYEYDELDFVKENGFVVHLTKYEMVNGVMVMYDIAPNKFEEKNDPIIKANSDYKILWEKTSDLEKLKPHVQGFINYLKSKGVL